MKHCNTCALKDEQRKICRLSGIPINLEEDFCSHHIQNLMTCEICGSPMLTKGSLVEMDSELNWHHYCAQCKELLKTCQICSAPCEFETNPDPMPKVVMKTVRQGNMQMQTQVMNPDRVNKFCLVCGCYDKELGCKRQFNVGCDKKPDFWTSRNPS